MLCSSLAFVSSSERYLNVMCGFKHETGRQTVTQAGRRTDSHTDWQANNQSYTQSNKQRVVDTDMQSYEQVER